MIKRFAQYFITTFFLSVLFYTSTHTAFARGVTDFQNQTQTCGASDYMGFNSKFIFYIENDGLWMMNKDGGDRKKIYGSDCDLTIQKVTEKKIFIDDFSIENNSRPDTFYTVGLSGPSMESILLSSIVTIDIESGKEIANTGTLTEATVDWNNGVGFFIADDFRTIMRFSVLGNFKPVAEYTHTENRGVISEIISFDLFRVDRDSDGTVDFSESVYRLTENGAVRVEDWDYPDVDRPTEIEIGKSIYYYDSESGELRKKSLNSKDDSVIYKMQSGETNFFDTDLYSAVNWIRLYNGDESYMTGRIEYSELIDVTKIRLEFLPIPEDGMSFTFSSGVGAWQTEIHLNKDGTFEGLFNDSDMGEIGDDYPNGTRYICAFEGKFGSIRKTGDYEYSMRLEYIRQEEVSGTEEIIDGIKYIYSDPYGFDNAGEFKLYLPGASVKDLPPEFIEWLSNPLGWDEVSERLLYYGLYNVGGEQGFFGEKQSSNHFPTK